MISKHISYKEGVYSVTAIRKGIDNEPNEEQLSNMKLVAEKIFEPVRTHFKVPIKVNSFLFLVYMIGAKYIKIKFQSPIL